MDKKTIIITLSILIIAASVAFNFEEFTGQASRLTVLQESLAEQPKGEGSVSVEPKVIEAGDYIHITIKPGNTCIDNEITIYKTDRKLPVTRFKKSAQYKGSSTGTVKYCKEATIQYKTWNSWAEGDYYVQVKELPMKVTGKIKERTVYYTDDFKIKATESYPKIIISNIGDLISNPQKISGQRYIFKD
jgi:hypothetical protein